MAADWLLIVAEWQRWNISTVIKSEVKHIYRCANAVNAEKLLAVVNLLE